MEYCHILSKSEIKDGRLNIRENSLEPAFYTWFEEHTGELFLFTVQRVYLSGVAQLLAVSREEVGALAVVIKHLMECDLVMLLL
jgi:hypothetical protein